jgi:nucleoid DNA-binding protein
MRLEGRKLFAEIAGKLSASWRPKEKLARQLAGRAKARGELVLFDQAVAFVKKPRAAFRSLERIDGEHLLDQIAAGVKEPTIRVYAPPAEKEKILTRGEIAARLASGERISLSAVQQLLDGLAQLVRQELAPGGPGAVRLPGIGTLRAASAPASARPGKRPDIEGGLAARLAADPVTKEPVLGRAAVHRLLDRLGALVQDELGTTGAVRLPRIGTLRSRGKRLDFTPSKSLGVDQVAIVP